MILRKLQIKVRELAGYYPVVVITGPRQAGKTTLCRAAFPDKPYVSLESLDMRDFARSDPRAFLDEYNDGAILDEIQQVPDLLSYLQGEVDSNPVPGRFILTGSQHFSLSQSISQSLAGRCGILALLPPDLEELTAFPNAPDDLYSTLWQGAYPRIYDRDIPAHQWLADYLITYIERDVRQVTNVGNLLAFTEFLKLCAGRTSCEINLSALGNDAGITHNTARAWLSILETSYIIHRLPAWHGNIRKQIVKAPKLHFLDSGLVCYLLGIHEPEQLRHHPLRGAIFESWVVAELYKSQINRGERVQMFHYRESRGPEIDVIVERGNTVHAIEIKSGATASSDYFKNFQLLGQRIQDGHSQSVIRNCVIYGGEHSQQRSIARLASWRDTPGVLDEHNDNK